MEKVVGQTMKRCWFHHMSPYFAHNFFYCLSELSL